MHIVSTTWDATTNHLLTYKPLGSCEAPEFTQLCTHKYALSATVACC